MTYVLICFLLLLIFGMPVAFAIGISGVVFFLQHHSFPMTTTVQLPISQTQNMAILAVPLFIFAGNLMNAGGVTKRLVILANLLTGHMRAGLAQVNVVLATFMGGVSGSATADAAMQARLLGPDMIKQGYSKGFTANTICYASLITASVPPGVGLILFGTTGSVSIGKLFAAGLTVGIVMMVVMMLTVYIIARVRDYQPVGTHRATIGEIITSLKETIWALLFPILLLVTIRFGLFTPSEVGGFACAYALVVGLFIYREMTVKRLLEAVETTVKDVGAIMLIISMSGIFGYGIPIDKIPQKVTALMLGVTNDGYLILLMIILVLMVLGMFMEGAVTIILLTPILVPLVKSVGVDPVHLGVLMCMMTTLAVNTPPVGMSMYTVNTILDVDLAEYTREMIPFLLATMLMMMALVFLPNITMLLPNLLF
jgi:tripartite ATP-independent transporter DctM subunit